MNDGQIKAILQTSRTIASVGLSPNPERPSLGVAYYLKSQGYRIIPVNPNADRVLDEKSYADLPSVPEKVDVVQIFRRPEDVPPIVEQAIQIGAKVVWMQEGISNEEAANRAEAAGLQVVMNRCMMQEHRRLFGR
ncbi:MAG: CoA-binding protein [Chloroflexi bacterium]|nr:CoA-binding protein [Chloroflexota bacterium]